MLKKFAVIVILTPAILDLVCLIPVQAKYISGGRSAAFGNIEIPFIVNQGQIDDRIIAYAQIFGGKVYVEKNGKIVYSFLNEDQRSFILEEHAVKGECNVITFEDKALTRINYFKGNDRSNWRSNILSYNVINLGELYDGITLKLKAYRNNIEKLFYIAPGADPDNIRLRINEAENLCVNSSGELEVLTEYEAILFTKPTAYQNIKGIKKFIDVEYWTDVDTYGFSVGDYDHDFELIIDPLLASTYLGGDSTEGGDLNWWIYFSQDAEGDIYVAGMTASGDFPSTPGAYEDTLKGDYDLFISKLSADLSTLQASTYLGGSNFDQIWSFDLDDSGNVYISGTTHSSDFPTSPGAYDGLLTGSGDAFISKFDADLTTLKASTYLGGNGYEFRSQIIINSNYDVYVGGTTDHNTFPWTPGAYDNSYNGNTDFFISKLNSNLTTLQASTFLGGTYREDYPTIQLDGEGNIFLCGSTGSHNYPWTSGAYDTTLNGSPGNDWSNLDICISKLSADLSTLLASTFVGADDYESGLLSCLDEASNIYVAGHTWDADFPVTEGVLDEGFSGDEYHIVKLDNNLTSLLAATFMTPDDAGLGYFRDLVSDQNGYIYVVGATDATDLPIVGDAYDPTYNGGDYDGFLMKINNDLTSIIYSTYLGGSGDDGIRSILFAENEDIYLVGYTNSSSDFPILPGAYDNDYNGGNSDCFIAKFTFDQFTRITEGPHVNDVDFTSGVCWIDYNNDNYLDLFLVTHWPDIVGPPLPYHYLYQNNGDGTFTSVNKLEVIGTGIEGYGASCADYDNDGDIDVLVANFKMDPCFLYVNDGSGNFTVDAGSSISAENAASSSPVWIDYDLNGILDLFIGNASDDNLDGYDPYPNYLYKDVAGIFTKIISGEIVTDSKHTYSATWSDYDNDGDPDLFTSSHLMEGNDLYRNDGNGNFTPMTGSVLSSDAGFCFSSSWADYDNDGDMDLYVGNIGGEPFLYSNNGDATFTKISGHGLHTDGGSANQGVWGDYDNDGDLDIFITRYNTDYPDQSQGGLFENRGGNTFNKITDGIIASDTHVVIAAAWGDYDRDGDLDLYTGRFDPLFTGNPIYSKNRLYRNNGNSNNWITIKPYGTNSNRSAIGTKIRLNAEINDSSIWQMREISSQTGSSAQQPLEAHFGLGDANIVDSIKIEWPSGMVDVYTAVAPNQFITYTETVCGDADGNFNVNLLDITYLISYLYKGGPDPHNMQAADPDGNGTTNILDITYLIAYLYKAGPKPVC